MRKTAIRNTGDTAQIDLNLLFVLISATLIAFRVPNCSANTGCSRNLTTHILCPGLLHNCTTEKDVTINLVHTEASGHNDSIHYIFSTWGVPSVLVAKTSGNVSLQVNYEILLNESLTQRSIRFSEAPQSVFVVMVAQVVDYEDENDKVARGENTSSIEYNLAYSTWNNVSVNNRSTQLHEIVFRMTNETSAPLLNPGGEVVITFRAPCDEGYYPELPNLQYNNNMSLADVVLNNVSTNFNKSRLAVQLIVATTSGIGTNMTIEKHKSIDDEHSPGSFVTMNWLTNANKTLSDAFLQWKPTCYKKPERNLQSLSSIQQEGKLIGPFPYRFKNDTNITTMGLAYEYFGDSLLLENEVNIASSNILFGLPGDGFYISTQYDAWSFSFGFGVPPSDKISLAIIMIIVVGLGIPVVLTIGGAVYICVRRYRRHDGYEEITGSYSEIN